MSDRTSPCNECRVRPKVPGQGQRYCAECSATREQRKEERRIAWATSKKEKPPVEPRQRIKRPVVDGKRECATCNRTLPVKRFGPHRADKFGLNPNCRPCASAYNHRRTIRVQYGLEHEQYIKLHDYQGGVCAVCGNKPQKYRLAVDHDHKAGWVRGLLCKRCNRDIIGRAHDDPAILYRAAEYLEAPPAFASVGFVRKADWPGG